MHVAPGREETAPAAAALVGLRIDALANLVEFVLNKFVVYIPVGVISRQYSHSILFPSPRDQPSGALGDKAKSYQLKDWIKHLRQAGEFP